MCQRVAKLILVTPAGAFWACWEGSLGSLLFSAGLGALFHRFGRCPNHDDFPLQFMSQSAPKLVLVTLAPFGSPFGGSICNPFGGMSHSFAVNL